MEKKKSTYLKNDISLFGILLRNRIQYYVCEMQSSAQEAIDEFALDQVIKDAPSERLSLHVAFVTHRIVRVIGKQRDFQTEKGSGECRTLRGHSAVEVSLWQREWTFLPGLTCFLNAGSTGFV